MDGVDDDDTDALVERLVIFSGDIAATLIDSDFHSDTHGGVHGADHLVLVEHLESVEEAVHVAGDEGGLSGDDDGGLLAGLLGDAVFQAHLLEIEDDVGNIFHDTGDGGELLSHTFDLDGGDGEAFQRGEQDAAECIADGHAVAGLEGAELKLTMEIIGFHHDDFIGFLKG